MINILTIINIILMSINLYIYQKEYLQNKRKNNIDIIPMFFINSNNIYFDNIFDQINQNEKINFSIPFYNNGNGIATDIELWQRKEKIGFYNGVIEKNNFIYFTLQKNLAFDSHNIQLKMIFSDLNGTKYEQNIIIKFML